MKFNLKYKACMCDKIVYHDYSATTIKYNPNKFTNVNEFEMYACMFVCPQAIKNHSREMKPA